MVYRFTLSELDADKQGFLDAVRHAYMLAGWGYDVAVWWDGRRFVYGFLSAVPVGECVWVVWIRSFRFEFRHHPVIGRDIAKIASVVAADTLEDVEGRFRNVFDPWTEPVVV